jgi:hypothetical protein
MNLSDAANMATIIGAFLVLIGGIYTSLGIIKKQRQKKQDIAHRLYSGEWNNTQEILADNYSHYVSLQLFYRKRKFNGRLSIRQGNDDTTWKHFFVTGKRRLSTLSCVAETLSGNQSKIMAKVKLISTNGHFEWILLKGETASFPLRTVLYKTLPTLI